MCRRRSHRSLPCAFALLLVGCGAAPGPAERAPTSRAAAAAPLASASAAPAALPFRMPCADDDLATCTQGCNDKVVEDCVTLGSIYLAGSGVTADTPRALDLFRNACEQKSARGCMRLADAYHKGLLGEAAGGDQEETSLYRRACDAGANTGCVAAGKAYLSGRGVGTDPVFAANLFGRVCQRGNAPACFELARLYEKGEGVPLDRTRAFEFFEKACKLGHDEGCVYASRTTEVLPPRN